MPVYTTPDRPKQQLSTPNGPQRLRPEKRPEQSLTRDGLQAAINEEVKFAQEKIVSKIDYVLKELKTEKNPVRRKEGFALISRLQRDDLADSNKKLQDYRYELQQRERAVIQWERENRDDQNRRF